MGDSFEMENESIGNHVRHTSHEDYRYIKENYQQNLSLDILSKHLIYPPHIFPVSL